MSIFVAPCIIKPREQLDDLTNLAGSPNDHARLTNGVGDRRPRAELECYPGGTGTTRPSDRVHGRFGKCLQCVSSNSAENRTVEPGNGGPRSAGTAGANARG